jgi:two-component system chemotaxis sensor kinase CheA
MIEDAELREIFKIESAEHIQGLEDGFLRLEKEPQNQAVLEEVFREAHSLKGASRIIGITDVESISHRLEDVLGGAKKGSLTLSSEIIDCLCKGVDAIRNLVREAVTGEPSGVTVSKALEQLNMSLRSSRPTLPEPVQVVKSLGTDLDGSGPDNPNSEVALATRQPDIKEATFGDFRIDTIRVETGRLDKLMSQTGELNVTKLRIGQRVEDIKGIIALWEEVSKSCAELGSRSATIDGEDSSFRVPFSAVEKLGLSLNSLKHAVYADSSRLDFVNAELEGSINRIRLMPLSTLFNLFQRMIRDLAKESAKEVRLVITGGDTVADKRIIEEMKDPLMHMVRNAIDHGIEIPSVRERKNKPRSATITMRAYHSPANVVIEVSDDGQGLDIEAIKRAALKGKIANETELAAMSPSQIHNLIFASGISTSTFISDVSGRGVGLDVVRANVERLKGAVEVESLPDRGCSIRVKLPLTLATTRVMLLAVNGIKYAVPVEHILTASLVHRKNIFTIEGRHTIVINNMPVSVMELSKILELKSENPRFETLPCIILSIGDDRVGILADELLDEQEIVLKQYSSLLKRVRNVSGATILGTGEVCMVLNPFDLVKSIKMNRVHTPAETTELGAETAKSVLVAEDSLTVRTQMKRIIEGAGYEVVVAVDGLDAFKKLSSRSFDALVSDINMPNMNGLTLTEKVRKNKKFKDMPVILVTSLASDEDMQRGLEAGANAYMAKPSFDQKVFLETLGRLV